jgi:hypothetical protein
MLQRWLRGRARGGAALFALVALTSCDSREGLIGVTPPASRIVFLSQPSNVQTFAAMAPVQIAVQNENGQTVGSGSVAVTITLVPGTGTAGALLTGGAAQNTTSGVVVFGNLRIDLAGTGYQLLASAQGFQAIASAPFDVTP